MSGQSPSLTLIQPLVNERSRPLWRRVRAYFWIVRELARTAPVPFTGWLAVYIFLGLMPPFQIWASGHLVNAIQAEIDGRNGNPWLWALAMASALAGVRLFQPIQDWCEAVVFERGIPVVHRRILARATEVDLALLEYQALYDVTRRIAEQADQSLKQSLRTLGELFRNGIQIGGAILILLHIHWLLVATWLLPLLPLLIISLRQGDFVWNALSDQTRDRRIAHYIATRFSDRQSAKEIRLFGLADEMIRRWEHHFTTTRKEMRGKLTRAFLNLELGNTWGDIVFYTAVIWVVTGGIVDLTAADITMLMGTFMTIGVLQIQQAMMEIGQYGGFAVDIRRFLSLPAPFAATPATNRNQSTTSIVLEHVSFAYPGTDVNVVDDVSLVIPPGQALAIVGENGAGKTTLLKLILGLYRPDSGRILFGDRDLQGIPVGERQSLMAAVFQTFSHYPENISDNITLPRDRDDTEMQRVIEEAGLDQLIADTPDGLETMLSPDLGGIDLSGGQWQRLAIARAGYRNAAILALDEPTAALDPLAEVDIFRRFAQLSTNRTTILISHRLGMTRLTDRIIVVEHGKITEDGSHERLLHNRQHYAELWEMQSRWYR